MIYKTLMQDYDGDISDDKMWFYSLVARNNDVSNMMWKLWSLDRKHSYYFERYERSDFFDLCKKLRLTIIDEREYYHP